MKLVRFALPLLFCGLVACKPHGSEAKLPPAAGQGAPAMPDLPTIDKPAADATEVTASEGRTTGTLMPQNQAQVGPSVSGVLQAVLVDEGQRVKKGAVLFKQDARDAVLRVQQAQAALAAAKVGLSSSETDYKRTKALFDQGASNQMQLDQMQARLDGARVGVQQAQVAVDMAQKMLADTTVRTPIDGVITGVFKSDGEMVTTMPPTVVVQVEDQAKMELHFRLPETAMSQVKLGDTITAAFGAVGITRQAKVIRNKPAVDPVSRTVEYVAIFDNADGALKSGLLAEVQFGQAPAAKNP
ncbi:MAG: efflux RND transporter periplasmic adaptor subunit [Deltaproteobacteria bacterium]|nr:efflux RND transporter periplasmic adaptor subunit [Deltaproteobacteria bacterium]